jgi:hypothetical protein
VNSDGFPASPCDWIPSVVNLATLDSRRQFSISEEGIEIAKKKAFKLAPHIARASFRVRDFHNFPREEWEPKVKYSGWYSPVWLIERR